MKTNLTTGAAFNNFDRLLETLIEKDTLHDTLGIAYQLSPEEIENKNKNTAFPKKIDQEEIPDVDLEVTPVDGHKV